MKVRMLDSNVGTRNGEEFAHVTGETYELPNEVAREYLNREIAEPVAEVPSGRRQQGRRETR